MPQTRDLGRVFVHGWQYPLDGAPRWERNVETIEVEPPYRLGKGFCVRLWGRRALVIGRWGSESRDEAQALYEALRARDMEEETADIVHWRAPEVAGG